MSLHNADSPKTKTVHRALHVCTISERESDLTHEERVNAALARIPPQARANFRCAQHAVTCIDTLSGDRGGGNGSGNGSGWLFSTLITYSETVRDVSE